MGTVRNLQEVWVTATSAGGGPVHVVLGPDVKAIEVHDESHLVVHYLTTASTSRNPHKRNYGVGSSKVTVGGGSWFEDPELALRDSLRRIKNRERALRGVLTKLARRTAEYEGALTGDAEVLLSLMGSSDPLSRRMSELRLGGV